MGKAIIPIPVKIIAGLISKDNLIFDKAISILVKKLGPVDLESAYIPFNHTDYYSNEMGGGLMRKLVSFRRLKKAGDIFKLKLITNTIERRLSSGAGRKINIDPGYLTLSKLVLLTTKNYTHRVYLKDGIYAEVTLFYSGGSFRPWEWTYPDYRTREYVDFFNQARQMCLADIKEG